MYKLSLLIFIFHLFHVFQFTSSCIKCLSKIKSPNYKILNSQSKSLQMKKSLKMNKFNDRPKVFSLEQLNHIIYFESSNDRAESILKKIMLDSIRWYRETLSPIMPPNCRFFPSCSNYALQAIEEFGPIKGGILTGWRIFRCNPFGNIIYI